MGNCLHSYKESEITDKEEEPDQSVSNIDESFELITIRNSHIQRDDDDDQKTAGTTDEYLQTSGLLFIPFCFIQFLFLMPAIMICL